MCNLLCVICLCQRNCRLRYLSFFNSTSTWNICLKILILRNRYDGSVTSNGGTAEMASKIFVSRQKLHSSLLPTAIFRGHFNFAGIPRSGRYDRLTRHRKIAACDSQIFSFAYVRWTFYDCAI